MDSHENKGLRGKIRALINHILDGHHDYYTSVIMRGSGKLSLLPSWVLKLLFSDVVINQTQTAFLSQLHEQGAIVYISKYKSNLEYLFYNFRYRIEDLPTPAIGFDQNILFA